MWKEWPTTSVRTSSLLCLRRTRCWMSRSSGNGNRATGTRSSSAFSPSRPQRSGGTADPPDPRRLHHPQTSPGSRRGLRAIRAFTFITRPLRRTGLIRWKAGSTDNPVGDPLRILPQRARANPQDRQLRDSLQCFQQAFLLERSVDPSAKRCLTRKLLTRHNVST